VAALGMFTAAAVAIVMFGGIDAVHLHQSVRTITSVTVLLVAMASALACYRVRAMQYAAVLVVLTGAGTVAAGSPAFLDRFGEDPFIAPSEAITWRTFEGQPRSEFPVPFYVADIRLSPEGRYVALVAANYSRDDHGARTFHIGPAGGPLAALRAADLVFVNEGRALVVEPTGSGQEVREIAVDRSLDVVWRRHVPDLTNAQLSYRPAERQWRLLGRETSRGIARAQGNLGTADVEYTRWPAPHTAGAWVVATATAGADAVVVESRWDGRGLQSSAFAPWAWLLGPLHMETRFRSVGRQTPGDLAVSGLTADCVAGALMGDRLLCSAFDGSRTRFIALDPGSRRITPLAWLPGRFARHGSSANGWLTGWADASIVALRLDTGEGLRVTRGHYPVTQLGLTDNVLATVTYETAVRSMVRLYSLP
jgi:hypothetical protein